MTWPLVTLVLGLVFGAAVLGLTAALILGIILELRKTRIKETSQAAERGRRIAESLRNQRRPL